MEIAGKPMPIDLEYRDGICLLRLSGRLAAGTSPEFLQAKMNELKGGSYTKVLADLRELVSIGSVGIGFLAGAYTSVVKNPGGRFVMVGPQKRVREALELTRISTVIPLVENVDSAMSLLNAMTNS
jgi:anti-anti-sigma factor